MNKQKLINYFNNIRSYIKLSELCKNYNLSNPDNKIDYNNLRNTINGTAPNRLSEEKLNQLYTYLVVDVFQKKFGIQDNDLYHSSIEEIIHKKTSEMLSEISEVTNYGFSNK